MATATISEAVQKVDHIQQQITAKCTSTKEMMQKSKQSQRAAMRQLRVLAQDITEMVTEVLDVNDAKKILYELLQDMGWEEGQTIQQNMTMSFFDQSMMDQNQTMGGASVIQNNSMRSSAASDQDKLLRNDFLSEMGVAAADTMTTEEKQNIERQKEDLLDTDLDNSMHAFAMQLTQVKKDLTQNRTVVANLFKEVEEFHEAQSKVMDEVKKDMGKKGKRRLQAIQNNMLLDTGHSAHQLSQAQHWANFTVPDPLKMTKVADNQFLLSSHDSENSCAMLQVTPADGFSDRLAIDTENHKVFSACLLNSNIPGVSMKLDEGVEAPPKEILLLGCNRGYLLKFEKGPGEPNWTKTGECRLEQSITDILQLQPMTVLAVLDEGIFDVIDVTSMQPTAHTPSLNGISKSYKTRMTQRGAGIAIADAKGFFFANVVSDNAGHYSVRLTDEAYAKNNAVNDFIEFKRDSFFLTILEANYFAIIERPQNQGFFDSGKTIKIPSVHLGYMTMGMELVPGPSALDCGFVMVRDRRGVQLINLKKQTSHQLLLSEVPVMYTDLKFLKLVYDERSHETHMVTLYYEEYPQEVKATVDSSSQADREGHKPLLAMYTFNREFQAGLISLSNNSVQDRTLF